MTEVCQRCSAYFKWDKAGPRVCLVCIDDALVAYEQFYFLRKVLDASSRLLRNHTVDDVLELNAIIAEGKKKYDIA